MTDRGPGHSVGLIQVLLLGSIVLNLGLVFDIATRTTSLAALAVVVIGLSALALRGWRSSRG